MLTVEKNQAKIERIEAYIKRHDVPYDYRFDANMDEVFAMAHALDRIEGIMLAFSYGMVKGYQQAKRDLKRKSA